VSAKKYIISRGGEGGGMGRQSRIEFYKHEVSDRYPDLKTDLFLCEDADEIIELVMDEKEIDIVDWWVEQDENDDDAKKKADEAKKKEATEKEGKEAAAAKEKAAQVINARITGSKQKKKVNVSLSRFEFYKQRVVEEYPDLTAGHNPKLKPNPEPEPTPKSK